MRFQRSFLDHTVQCCPRSLIGLWTLQVKLAYGGLCMGPVEEGEREEDDQGLYPMALSSNNGCSSFFHDLMCSLCHFCPSPVPRLTINVLPASTGVSLSTLLPVSNERSCLAQGRGTGFRRPVL